MSTGIPSSAQQMHIICTGLSRCSTVNLLHSFKHTADIILPLITLRVCSVTCFRCDIVHNVRERCPGSGRPVRGERSRRRLQHYLHTQPVWTLR